MGPIRLEERLEVLDVVRGAALSGIIISNMRAFNGPLAAYFDHSLMWTDTVSRVTQALIDLFVSNKFITIFSFLFGVGFAIQMDRAATRGLVRHSFYVRRMAALLLFGLLHGLLFWWGDILLPYALMGFGLLLFRSRSPRTLLIWASVFYCWPLLLNVLFLDAAAPAARVTQTEIARLVHLHATGSYGTIFAERLNNLAVGVFAYVFYYPRFFGVFLTGLWVWRAGIVRNLASLGAGLRTWQRWGFAVGLPLNLIMVAIGEIWHPSPMAASVSGFFYLLAGSLGTPLLSLFYVTTLARLFLDPARGEWMRGFAAVGRTALTNYLLQSVICTTLFYGYGLGWFGRVAPLPGLLLSMIIYATQIPLTLWWTRRFAYGPMEWLWRRLTYGGVVA